MSDEIVTADKLDAAGVERWRERLDAARKTGNAFKWEVEWSRVKSEYHELIAAPKETTA